MRMSLPGSCGLPGSVYSSRTPLPLVSTTSAVQPCDFSMSPVSSSILVLIQPTLPPPPPNDPHLGAKELFGRKLLPAAMPTRVIGFYAKGCIAGAEGLPINGDTWQGMRLSRNRYWGH